MFNSISRIIIFIIAITFVEESLLSRNSLIAEEIKSHLVNKPQNKFSSSSNTLLAFNNQFSIKLSEDLNILNNKVLDLFVNNPDVKEDKFAVSIESQTQYEKDNIFYAEGDVVIYLSNAKLEGEIASYDKNKKQFVIQNNVKYTKGSQYFEASKVFFDFAKDNGYIENVYGVLDLISFNEDFNLDASSDTEYSSQYDNELSDLEYVTSATFGLVNDFEKDKRFNLTEVKFEVPKITKWRFKSDKIKVSSDTINSDLIYFTNDAFNKPQFIFRSKKFRGEIIDDKLKLVSRQSRLFFDDFLSIPIGKRTIFDKDPLTSWGLGSDYEEMDGFYISRGFGEVKIFDDYSLRLRPYFLMQRALNGKTNSFREKNASILSGKIKNQKNTFLDIFAIDAELKKKFNSWNFILKTKLNSLNTERFSEANRSKITLTKTLDLNKKSKNSYFDLLEKEYTFNNKIDFQLYGAYREKIIKGFSGDAEIYLAKGARIANRRSWDLNDKKTDLSFIYDIGEYKAEKKNVKELDELFRHVFAIKYSYLFPIWEKKKIDKNISANYRYSPKVINQGISWITNIDAGIFLYSNGSSQEAISFSSGPKIILGSFTNSYFDYSSLEILATFPVKGNESPFIFDNIDRTKRIQFNFNQQLLGPVLFGYKAYLNLDSDSNDYGKFKDPTYSIDISRRAYSLGAFYKPSSESLGIQFNIFNFDYSGLSSKF